MHFRFLPIPEFYPGSRATCLLFMCDFLNFISLFNIDRTLLNMIQLQRLWIGQKNKHPPGSHVFVHKKESAISTFIGTALYTKQRCGKHFTQAAEERKSATLDWKGCIPPHSVWFNKKKKKMYRNCIHGSCSQNPLEMTRAGNCQKIVLARLMSGPNVLVNRQLNGRTTSVFCTF